MLADARYTNKAVICQSKPLQAVNKPQQMDAMDTGYTA